ncbi:MTOR-associated protein MEAK7 [Rana temporaria]|uniref:MTOR-associated protein MEAK7 n=1 Tax=Rana temporaria TaxID=8407 RepID=UPI001AAD453D|nr:MTOR-associated protein MEAK7 [Rana temporaria]XP_040185291.1 MTOR-associated protein MEAK7 [Rana temporaria]XP_040185292.1 MTOR-associated protein MEAK7 [Rana temporaria]XP_040185293.1 MTOR-associated protein MEAK7 [Rana temporaria]XP_040185294.1 MTOR-associated protein MEAK7 [Rana temporaria]
MGNTESSVFQKRLAQIPPADQLEIESSFENLCQAKNSSKKGLGLAAFQDSIGNSLPSAMSNRIFHGIQSQNPASKASPAPTEISIEQYALFIVDILRGTVDEKGAVAVHMMTSDNKEVVTGQEVQKFLEDLIWAVVYVLQRENALRGWSLENTHDCKSGTLTLAAQLLSPLHSAGEQTVKEVERLSSSYTQTSITDWLYKTPMVSMFLRIVVRLGLSIMRKRTEQQLDLGSLVPKCKKGKLTSFCSLLDFPSVMFLNSHLPSEMQQRWRLLFSTQIHGESFSKLCGQLVDQGPSLLVLRDSDGSIFGGFASQSWEVKPQFKGDSRCFLFTVSPNLNIYTYTGYNDHYMYLNHGQQTMPNGLGMGGQHDYFGLWIDSNFGKGHSRAKPRCTTYNSPQLSGKEDFAIDTMEVWALGELPEHLQAKNKKSVLDANPEVQALLEMTGRARQSEGLRDKEEDDE